MSLVSSIVTRWWKYNFLFEELVKRDFKKKYKRTVLGIIWSLLGPLLQLFVMALVFTYFFGMQTEHFIVYMFSGLLVFNYFKEATNGGMQALIVNASIITKVSAPKYIYLLSKNVSVLLNFVLTLIVFFLFVIIEPGLSFHPRFLFLLFPIMCLLLFNIGVGMVLSAFYVFFRDTQYLYDIFTMLLMWMSAIFYPVSQFSPLIQRLFVLNPIYAYIQYFRLIVLYRHVPSFAYHLICATYAIAALLMGFWIYKRYNYRFIYYM